MNVLLKTMLPTLALITFSLNSYAMPPKPKACPKATAIKQAGLAYAEKEQGTYIAYQISSYGTKNTWGFGIGEFQASSPQDAISQGYKALASLRGNPKPMPVYDENVWACLYSNNSGYMAAAFTPIPMSAKMKRTMMLPAQ